MDSDPDALIYRTLYQEFSHLRAGDPIPSVRRLMTRFKVSQLIIDRVLLRLAEHFAIESQVGRGRFLAANAGGGAPGPASVIHLYLTIGESSFHATLHDAVAGESASRGLTVRVHRYPWEHMPERYADGPETAGILVVPPSFLRADDVVALAAAQAPLVLLDRVPLGLRLHGIASDNALGGSLAADHLMRQGLRRLAIIASEPSICPNVGARIRGFQRQCYIAGLPQPPLIGGDSPAGVAVADAAYARMRDVLAAGPLPYDGLFADSSATAMGVLRACREAAICIPDQLALVAFDDTPESRCMNPTITVLRQDIQTWAATALDILAASREPGRQVDLQHVQVPPVLVVRESSQVPHLTTLS